MCKLKYKKLKATGVKKETKPLIYVLQDKIKGM